MARQRSDPKVKEYMKSHPGAVERVQARYDELKSMPICDLCALASATDHDDRMRMRFITEIIKGEAKK